MTEHNATDRSGLNWVKKELDETLRQAADALEAASEDSEALDELEVCQAGLHQVRGILNMLGLKGGQLLTEEMERVSRGLLDEALSDPVPAQETLMRALLQLPDYLEKVQSGRLRDHPGHVLPQINELRQARGEEPLPVSAYFQPDLDVSSDRHRRHTGGEQGTTLAATARRLRTPYQRALLGVLRSDSPRDDLLALRQILDELDLSCGDDQRGALWWIAGGLVEALEHGLLRLDHQLRRLLGRVDRELRRVAETGQEDQSTDTRAELLRELLYHVARAHPETERIKTIQQQYRLADHLEQLPDDEGRAPNREVVEAVVGALREDIASAKDALDLFARSDGQDQERLEVLEEILAHVGDTLRMLGLDLAASVVRDQINTVAGIRRGEVDSGEYQLGQVAQALLYVEAALQSLVYRTTGIGPARSATRAQAPGKDPSRTEQAVFQSEYQQVFSHALAEALTEFERAKQALIRYSNSFGADTLEEADGSLEGIRGLLRMTGLERADQQLQRIQALLRERLLPEQAETPAPELLDLLADAVTGLEYYLEGIAEDRANRDQALDVTDDAVARLSERLPVPGEAQGAEPGMARASLPEEASAPGTEEGAEPPDEPEPGPVEVAQPDAGPEGPGSRRTRLQRWRRP